MIEENKDSIYKIQHNHLIKVGNDFFIKKQYLNAISSYLDALYIFPELEYVIKGNIDRAKAKFLSKIRDDKDRAFASQEANKQTPLTYNLILNELLNFRGENNIFHELDKSNLRLELLIQSFKKNTDSPLISIIMPTHNRAHIIQKSILTVLNQSYENFELIVCDDGSTDDTADVINKIADRRIMYLRLDWKGAASARNVGLAMAKGEYFAYLDSDNYWHPSYLEVMISMLSKNYGHSSIFCDYIDYFISKDGHTKIRPLKSQSFNHEHLLNKPFIDLNSFFHHRELYDIFGGFNPELKRRQDYDLILKYTWLRDPLHLRCFLTLYQRNEGFAQITTSQKSEQSSLALIQNSLNSYLNSGLPLPHTPRAKRITIVSWDLCRNHFSKAFALAEALSSRYEIQLISFKFFDEDIFSPLKGVNPNFETVYLPGSQFPNFFDSMEVALNRIKGDIIYAIKPRLPSLGLALLANARFGIPIALEINDLETVVSNPNKNKHKEVNLTNINFCNDSLLSPYDDLWSQLLDPISKDLPVLVTHNKNLDKHYAFKCLYMRNPKNEKVYDPSLYSRDEIRSLYGFNQEDRVILFGGLLRKHKGIFELVELLRYLNDDSYKLIFVGSRETPDQIKLLQECRDRVFFLPPQDRTGMAKINLAADLVILWLNPEIPASHYQFPYKATDALSMGTPIITNNISDLGGLASQGYMHEVPFGNLELMKKTISKIFDDKKSTDQIRAAGMRLYRRQFSYAAMRANFEIVIDRAIKNKGVKMPLALQFSNFYDNFYNQTLKKGNKNVTGIDSTLISGDSISEKDCIRVIATTDLANFNYQNINAAVVVMPCINRDKGLETASLLLKRAGMKTMIFIVLDMHRQGFIKTVNAISEKLEVRYLVYAAEDAFPSRDWLKMAYESLEQSGKGLLAFNCGKWHGLIAAFGMVRLSWIRSIYPNSIFYPGYINHRADNELTIVARAQKQFIYLPSSVLMEIDRKKDFRDAEDQSENFNYSDKKLFKHRMVTGFDGLFSEADLSHFYDEYLNRKSLVS